MKRRDIEEVASIMQMNRFTVYDFDTVHQTALHWAAKRGCHEIIKLLISKGAIIDAKDLGNRTPLIIAAKMGHVK